MCDVGESVSEAPFFSVLVLNYNAGDYLQQAVDSLVNQTFSDFEVVIADNGSGDGSMEILDVSRLAECRVELLGRNAGFAEGNNIMAKLAQGKWLVLLNADAAAKPDWLETLHRNIHKYPDCAMFASTQLSMSDPDMLDGAGDAYSAWGFAWRGGYRKETKDLPGFGETFSPCGASAAIRKEEFLAHGGFDERYFCFMEDVDLAFRMRLAGEYCLFLPDAVVSHMGGGISGEKTEFAVVNGARNRLLTFVGNMPTPLFLLTLPGHIALTLYLLGWYVTRPYGSYARKGVWEGLKDAMQYRRNRAALRKERKISLWQLARMMYWNPMPLSKHGFAVRPYDRK